MEMLVRFLNVDWLVCAHVPTRTVKVRVGRHVYCLRAIPFEKLVGGCLMRVLENPVGWSKNSSDITAGWSYRSFFFFALH